LVPLYVVMRQHWGAIGLAIASSVSILVYVLLLGWLQRRRFEREATAKGTTLENVPGMLDTALRLAVAAAIAIGVGLGLRAALLQFLPEIQLWALLIRATVLCVFGIGIYVAGARLLGVHELAEIEGMLLRKLNLKRRT
jgi:putative peptidoglycan lipid II flippase